MSFRVGGTGVKGGGRGAPRFLNFQKQKLVFGQDLFVNSICLPNKFDSIDESWDGEMFTITGFGEINSERDIPRKLQRAQKSMKIQF